MAYDIKLLDLPEQPTLGVRGNVAVQNLPQFIGPAYGHIMQHLATLGEQPAGMPFVAYYNMDMQNLAVEAAFPVARPLPGAGEVQAGCVPAGKFVTCFFAGPYDALAGVYEAMSAWIQANGYETTGAAYEYYFNNPNEGPGIVPETEVRFQLKT